MFHPLASGRRCAVACVLLFGLASPAGGGAPWLDLDVGVPPGEPTGWARWLPAITPRRGALFPQTQPRDDGGGRGGRTVSTRSIVPLDPQIGGAGMLRITTLDVVQHLDWVGAPPGPRTGVESTLPNGSPAGHWLGTAAFLRLLLHRQQVSKAELVAHLVELGELSLSAIDAAMAERALEPTARLARVRIEHPGPAVPGPAPAATTRAQMLQAFCRDELAQAHPYDPDGSFGLRLFQFAGEMEPMLAECLAADAGFVARNAAVALGRYHTVVAQQALLRAIATTEDPVVLVRACAALGSPCESAALLARLRGSKDPIETVALVQALGRIGANDAVDDLVPLLRQGLRSDPDLLMTTLIACCRVTVTAADAVALRPVLEAIERAVRGRRERFEVAPDHAGPAADTPDTGGLRGEILGQLALLARVRLDADNAKLRAAVFELLEATDRARAGASLANVAMGSVWPPAQMPMVETLRLLGEDGQRALAAIVADTTCDPVLRATAIAQLPIDRRDKVALEWLDLVRGQEDLQTAAIQVLDQDDGALLAAPGAAMLAGMRRFADATATQRSVWLAMLQALDRRGALRSRDLVPLLDQLPDEGVALGRRSTARLREQLVPVVDQLVADVAAGLGREVRVRRVEGLIELVVGSAIDARFVGPARVDAVRYLVGLLAGLPKKRGDAAYRQMVARSVLDYLVQVPPEVALAQMERYQGEVPLEPAILFALGRTGDDAAVAAIERWLEKSGSRWRASACLAAGVTGSRRLLRPLARALSDADPFVRLCAYEALRHLSGEDHFADWCNGTAGERGAAAQEWFRCAVRLGR